MRLIFWVTALAVLSIASAKNSTTKTKPKRQLESIRTHENLQYSLVLPHSRVAHFRSLPTNRRISHTPKGKLPPYAVQMEPVVQYSQKDPLYDPTHENLNDAVENKNEIYAQSKILNVQDQSGESYGPPYGSLPTAPLYSHDPHPHYYEAPEPIIEIIIKESNESLPAPPPPPVQKKKKEPVHVFYVKYSKDPHSKDKVIYEKPIPAITPATNDEDDHDHHHHNEYVTVTPEPYIPPKTTTLRAIIKPESEVYHSDSSVRVTFGSEGRHYSDRREENTHTEDHEETAPKPAIAFPNEPLHPSHPPLERSASPKPQQFHESSTRPSSIQSSAQTFRSATQTQLAQSRIQFQPQYASNDQHLPFRQEPSVSPFRPQTQPSHIPFGPTPTFNAAFSNGPISPASHFGGPTVSSPVSPTFPTGFPRPNPGPSFHSRVSQSSFGSRPQFNGPPRTSFHSGPPQRPFPSQSKNYFDDPKYLQENYHTITTEQVEPSNHQLLPNRQQQSFNSLPQPSPSPTSAQFQEHRRPPVIPLNQQLPQQRQHQQFAESSKPSPAVSPSSSPFFNLKPSPPHVDDNRPPFHQQHQQSFQQSFQHQSQQQFGFHQGPQALPRPSPQILTQQNSQQHQFSGQNSPSPSPIPQTQFVPQSSSAPLYNFHPQPSPTPEVYHHHGSPSERPQFQQSHGPSERPQFQQSHGPSERPQFQQSHGPSERPQFQQSHGPSERPQFQQSHGPSERPQFQQSHGPSERPQFQQSHGPSERPQFQQSHGPSERPFSHQNDFQSQSNTQHQQNIGSFVPNGGELVPAISKYEQHITVNGPTAEPFSGLGHPGPSQPTPTSSHPETQYHQTQQQQQQQIQQQQYRDAEQAQVRQQLAENVKKQQEEIQRLQAQLLYSQQQQQQQQQQQLQQSYQQQVQATSPRSQYIQERSRPHLSSTASPQYYQSTSRTVEIKPTTQKYVSSTQNSASSTPEPKTEVKKNKPTIELPDEVPDDLREQLLSSGILDNADISVLDYDKVGETPLESLPPDQLANFFGAGGGQQIASSENRPVYVKPNGDRIESRIDEEVDDDQDFAASENVPSYVAAPPSQDQAVEMKVVHFDPETTEGQELAKEYIQENATQVDPVALNDKRYNRYLPLKVSGNQFPLPDILKGRKITSVVVLAPVETEALGDHSRKERAASENLKGIKFVAGESLQDLLKRPTKDNFEKWLEVEKKTATDLQSVILLVTGDSEATDGKEIFMYDAASGNVNKLSGELSNAFVEAAENNSLSKDIESLAIEGEGIPENFNKDAKDEIAAEGSENVPLFVDLSGVSLDQKNKHQISISSGYSKTKHGRSLRRH